MPQAGKALAKQHWLQQQVHLQLAAKDARHCTLALMRTKITPPLHIQVCYMERTTNHREGRHRKLRTM
jgi:hypothetical protein